MLDDDDKRWIEAQLEALETKILTAFHAWASPNEARQRSHRDAIHALELDMERFEARLRKLEQRSG
ncbi:MAG: hypothetical protein IT161_20150 [Bryobacterales bacterium]|nr:hypothetical protein [Bryobacterales bacterium]